MSQNQLGILPITTNVFVGAGSKFYPAIVIIVPPPKETLLLEIRNMLMTYSKSSAIAVAGVSLPQPALVMTRSYFPVRPP